MTDAWLLLSLASMLGFWAGVRFERWQERRIRRRVREGLERCVAETEAQMHFWDAVGNAVRNVPRPRPHLVRSKKK